MATDLRSERKHEGGGSAPLYRGKETLCGALPDKRLPKTSLALAERNPIDGSPPDVHTIVSEYSRKLQPSEIPKLLFCAHPGGIIGAKELDWCRSTLKNLETVDIGSGIHYLQEDNPHQIGSELARWYRALD